MTPNVKEHAYLIKTRDDKRSCDRDDDPLMVHWYKFKPFYTRKPCSKNNFNVSL